MERARLHLVRCWPRDIIDATGTLAFSRPDCSRIRFETWITLGVMRDLDGRAIAHNAARAFGERDWFIRVGHVRVQ